jgi:hypothetical protein
MDSRPEYRMPVVRRKDFEEAKQRREEKNCPKL